MLVGNPWWHFRRRINHRVLQQITTLTALNERLLSSRDDCFFSRAQAITYDHILSGRDIIGKSRTGTGKTIAFGLPVIQHLGRFAEDHQQRTYQRGRSPRFLVVCPTRELARQVWWD